MSAFAPRYACVAMDPPWAEYGGGGRGAQNHYPLMQTSDIARTILQSSAWSAVAHTAHLWCWVTDNYLVDGLSLIDRLGFTYKRTFCWVKLRKVSILPEDFAHGLCDLAAGELQIGLGQYARGSHELCLFATRGDAMVPKPKNRPPSVIFAPRQEHSRKPDEAFSRWFEAISPGPRLEMFARTARPGWDAWGFEAPSIEAAITSACETPSPSATPPRAGGERSHEQGEG